MPHLHLEPSPNLKEKIDPSLLFAPCFDIVSKHLKVEVSVCSGRVTVSDLFYMGDKKQQGFILH